MLSAWKVNATLTKTSVKPKTGDLLRGGKGRVLDPLTNLHYSLEPERACLTHLGGHPVFHN